MNKVDRRWPVRTWQNWILHTGVTAGVKCASAGNIHVARNYTFYKKWNQKVDNYGKLLKTLTVRPCCAGCATSFSITLNKEDAMEARKDIFDIFVKDEQYI
jgi:hypothetical protein